MQAQSASAQSSASKRRKIVLSEYFVPSNAERHREYLTCLEQNSICQHIDEIVLFVQPDTPLPQVVERSSKIFIETREVRPTYADIIAHCNEKYYGDICLIANGDIMFTDTLSLVEDLEGQLLALTRWDVHGTKAYYYDAPFRDGLSTALFSQDVWAFQAPLEKDLSHVAFNMGKPGCDNRIAWVAEKIWGLSVRNPSKAIITYHLHGSNYRTYTTAETIPGPYLMVPPTDNLHICPNTFEIPHF